MDTKVTTRVNITNYLTGDDKPVDLSFVASLVNTFTDGTGSGEADEAFHDTRTLGAAASEDLDLAGGLTRGGLAYTFTKVKVLMVKAASGNAEDITVGGAAANQFAGPFDDVSDEVNVPPGGVALFVHPGAGWTVTAATGDLLKVLAGASGGDYTIVIVGVATVA